MIDKVIVCGLKRANQLIPITDIKQFIGRSGRSYDKSGQAIILCDSSQIDYAKKCLYDESPPIISELNQIESISFHVLPCLDRIYDEQSFQSWYKRSLSYLQGKEIHWQEIHDFLLNNECINEENELTEFGKISVKMYISPEKLMLMKNKLLEVMANGDVFDPLTISYILSSQYIPIANANAYELSEYKSQLSSQGYMFEHGELIHAFSYCCIFSNNIPKWIKPTLSSLKEDLPRLFNALIQLCIEQGLKQEAEKIKIFQISSLKRVPIQIAEIINEFNLNKKTSAYELNDMGIKDKNDLKYKEDYLIEHATESLKKDLQENGFLKDWMIKEWKMNINN